MGAEVRKMRYLGEISVFIVEREALTEKCDVYGQQRLPRITGEGKIGYAPD
jgi:hypothetical protein